MRWGMVHMYLWRTTASAAPTAFNYCTSEYELIDSGQVANVDNYLQLYFIFDFSSQHFSTHRKSMYPQSTACAIVILT